MATHKQLKKALNKVKRIQAKRLFEVEKHKKRLSTIAEERKNAYAEVGEIRRQLRRIESATGKTTAEIKAFYNSRNREIYEDYLNGERVTDMAVKHKISKTTIYNVIKKQHKLSTGG